MSVSDPLIDEIDALLADDGRSFPGAAAGAPAGAGKAASSGSSVKEETKTSSDNVSVSSSSSSRPMRPALHTYSHPPTAASSRPAALTTTGGPLSGATSVTPTAAAARTKVNPFLSNTGYRPAGGASSASGVSVRPFELRPPTPTNAAAGSAAITSRNGSTSTTAASTPKLVTGRAPYTSAFASTGSQPAAAAPASTNAGVSTPTVSVNAGDSIGDDATRARSLSNASSSVRANGLPLAAASAARPALNTAAAALSTASPALSTTHSRSNSISQSTRLSALPSAVQSSAATPTNSSGLRTLPFSNAGRPVASRASYTATRPPLGSDGLIASSGSAVSAQPTSASSSSAAAPAAARHGRSSSTFSLPFSALSDEPPPIDGSAITDGRQQHQHTRQPAFAKLPPATTVTGSSRDVSLPSMEGEVPSHVQPDVRGHLIHPKPAQPPAQGFGSYFTSSATPESGGVDESFFAAAPTEVTNSNDSANDAHILADYSTGLTPNHKVGRGVGSVLPTASQRPSAASKLFVPQAAATAPLQPQTASPPTNDKPKAVTPPAAAAKPIATPPSATRSAFDYFGAADTTFSAEADSTAASPQKLAASSSTQPSLNVSTASQPTAPSSLSSTSAFSYFDHAADTTFTTDDADDFFVDSRPQPAPASRSPATGYDINNAPAQPTLPPPAAAASTVGDTASVTSSHSLDPSTHSRQSSVLSTATAESTTLRTLSTVAQASTTPQIEASPSVSSVSSELALPAQSPAPTTTEPSQLPPAAASSSTTTTLKNPHQQSPSAFSYFDQNAAEDDWGADEEPAPTPTLSQAQPLHTQYSAKQMPATPQQPPQATQYGHSTPLQATQHNHLYDQTPVQQPHPVRPVTGQQQHRPPIAAPSFAAPPAAQPYAPTPAYNPPAADRTAGEDFFTADEFKDVNLSSNSPFPMTSPTPPLRQPSPVPYQPAYGTPQRPLPGQQHHHQQQTPLHQQPSIARPPIPSTPQQFPVHHYQPTATPGPQQYSAPYNPAATHASTQRPWQPPPPHPVMVFGFGGSMAAIFPHQPRALNPHQQQQQVQHNVAALQPGYVTVYPMSKLLHRSYESVVNFPGPLLKPAPSKQQTSDTKQALEEYMQDCIAGVYDVAPNIQLPNTLHHTTYSRLLYKFLHSLLSAGGSVARSSNLPADQQKGAIELAMIQPLQDSEAPYFLSLAAVHAQRTRSAPLALPAPGLVGGSSLVASSEALKQPAEIVEDRQRKAEAVLEIQRLLLSGDRQAACEVALHQRLWSHALLLAAQDRLLHEKVVARFATEQFVDGSPVQTIYLMLAKQHSLLFRACPPAVGLGQESSSVATTPPAQTPQDILTAPPLIRNWRANVAAILANPSQNDRHVLTTFGDILLTVYGQTSAAHLCYLLAAVPVEVAPIPSSRLVLIGVDHRHKVLHSVLSSSMSLQRTEIYEYARHSADPTFYLPQSLVYRYAYACLLADIGEAVRALAYIESIHAIVKHCKGYQFSPLVLQSMEQFENRLRVHLNKVAPEAVSKKMWSFTKGVFDKGLNMLVGDESTAAAGAGAPAPAATVNPSPSLTGNRAPTGQPLKAFALPSQQQPMHNGASQHFPPQQHQRHPTAPMPPTPQFNPSATQPLPSTALSQPSPQPSSAGASHHTRSQTSNVAPSSASKVLRSASAGVGDKAGDGDASTSTGETVDADGNRWGIKKIFGKVFGEGKKVKQASLKQEHTFAYDEGLGKWVMKRADGSIVEDEEERPPSPPKISQEMKAHFAAMNAAGAASTMPHSASTPQLPPSAGAGLPPASPSPAPGPGSGMVPPPRAATPGSNNMFARTAGGVRGRYALADASMTASDADTPAAAKLPGLPLFPLPAAGGDGQAAKAMIFKPATPHQPPPTQHVAANGLHSAPPFQQPSFGTATPQQPPMPLRQQTPARYAPAPQF